MARTSQEEPSPTGRLAAVVAMHAIYTALACLFWYAVYYTYCQ